MYIDLRSDTVTKPSEGMLQAMFSAQVGDDVFSEDPSVLALEQQAASMFGMEAALFCPSGTMTNQIAIKLHTQALDEIICHELSHIQKYELGGYAFHSGVSTKLISGNNGKIRPLDISENINPDFDWLPPTRLVCLENTVNRAGGTCYTLAEMEDIYEVCRTHHLPLHLDGARIFNALIATNSQAKDIGQLFDSISVCLSKGLGAPIGSLLIGKKDFIKRGRRVRKVMGGGMRQAGYLAAAGSYALNNNISRLAEDHARAKKLGTALADCHFVEKIQPIATNIVIADLRKAYTAYDLVDYFSAHHIKTVPMDKHCIRMVTHLDFTDEMLKKALEVLHSIANNSVVKPQ